MVGLSKAKTRQLAKRFKKVALEEWQHVAIVSQSKRKKKVFLNGREIKLKTYKNKLDEALDQL